MTNGDSMLAADVGRYDYVDASRSHECGQ